MVRVKAFTAIFFSLFLAGCITTTTSSIDAKKDLQKAELTYVQIGYGYFERGQLQEAKKALIKALDINSKSAGAHMGLARVYERELEFKLADDHFQKALRYEETTEGHFQYGVYLYNRGDLKSAYKELNKVLKDTVYVRRPVAFEYQGVISTRLDKIDEAITYYRRAIALNPMMANSHIGLTNIYFNRQDFATSYSYFNGFVGLVRAQLARHTASTLWLGIQLADINNDKNSLSSLVLQLKNQFSTSNEYKLYIEWLANKDAA